MKFTEFPLITPEEREAICHEALSRVAPAEGAMDQWHFVLGLPHLDQVMRDLEIDNPEELVSFLRMDGAVEPLLRSALYADLNASGRKPAPLARAIESVISRAALTCRQREDGITIYGARDLRDCDLGVIALTETGRVAGFYLDGHLMVDPKSRGKGLGTDLVIDCLTYMGAIDNWDSPEPIYSEAGLKTHLKAWEQLGREVDLSRYVSPCVEDPEPA